MKIEITNEYEPYSEYLKAQGKDFLAGIKECWGDWAEISFQTHKDIRNAPDYTIITIEFNDMSKLGTVMAEYERSGKALKIKDYKFTKMWQSIMLYAMDSLSSVKFSNGDYIISEVYSPEMISEMNESGSVTTRITKWSHQGRKCSKWDTDIPFDTRILEFGKDRWYQIGIGDEWFPKLHKLLPKDPPTQNNA